MREEVAAVSCPSCGAGLMALGGGRVVLQVCAHCGAAMDAVDNYRLLKTFADRHRPQTPFQLGAKGRIDGVDWTVIGVLGWHETWAGQSWNWVDHQLYSPTHGYAWLTLENGHLILTRAWRGPLGPNWITPQAVERAETPPTIRARDRTYTYYETSDAGITYAEGEFSSVAMVGDRVQSLCFLSQDEMLTLTQSGVEREVELSSWPPQAETWASFGLTPPAKPWRVHPLQPYRPWREERFLGMTGLVVACASLVLGLFLLSQGERVKPVTQPGTNPLAFEAEIPITRTLGLTRLVVETDLYNAWSGIEVEVTDPNDTPVFQVAREVGYYQGVEGGDSWSEGDQTLSISFRPEVAGDYRISLDVPEGGRGEGSEGSPISNLRFTAYEGQAATFWMWLVFAVSLPIAGLTPLRSWLHDKARWRGTDWSDED
jgi:hypothetical protein